MISAAAMAGSLSERLRDIASARWVLRWIVYCEFRDADALTADISAATVVTLYMLPWFNEKVKPNFQKMLKPRARIVAHDFGIEGWKPQNIEVARLRIEVGRIQTPAHALFMANSQSGEL